MGSNVLILKPGETVIVPSSVDITSIITEDGATLTTDCEGLPTTEQYVCIRYNFAESNAPDPAALEDLTLNYITIGGTQYDFNLTVTNAVDLQLAINNSMGPVFKVYSASGETGAFNDRHEYAFAVKVPASLKDSILFNMSGTGFPNGFNLLSVDQTDCECLDATGKEQYSCDEDL
jgi:hypothetical protein